MKTRNILNLLILASLFIAAGCTETGSEQTVRYTILEGQVLDRSGEPLENITVKVQQRKTFTGVDGSFRIDSLQRGSATVLLMGEEGTGKYRLDLDRPRISMDMEYPVVTTLVLLHDNDQHFNFNYQEAFRNLVEQYRQEYENVWLLNTGDIFVRHAARWPDPYDTSYYAARSKYIIDVMNEMGYDVMAPGNHEFDYIGTHTLESLNRATFPMVTANVDVATVLLPQFDPFVVLEAENGVTIAVLGLSVGMRKPGVVPRDIVETAKAYSNLADEHELFVALTHIGYRSDKVLAEEVPELDVIIGGHSHTLLESAEMVNGVLVAQAAGGGHFYDPERPKWLGKIKVVMENDRVVEKWGRVVMIDSTNYESFVNAASLELLAP